MKKYEFIQRYSYGNDWSGELINIPDSARFYNVDNLSKDYQEWYVLIHINDFNKDYMGNGCCQVTQYVLFDYVIIHLKNITPVGMWDDMGEKTFKETFSDMFNEWYVYEYKQPMYTYKNGTFTEVEKEVLLGVSRIKGIMSDCKVNTTTVFIRDRFRDSESFGIIQSEYDFYDMDKLSDDEEDFFDSDFKKELLEKNQYRVSTAGSRYLLITKDSTLYEKLFNEIKDKLF